MISTELAKDTVHFAKAVAAFALDPVPAHYFQIDRGFVNLTPARTEAVFMEEIHRSPQIHRMCEDKYLAAHYTLEDLRRHGPDTLGHAYRAHMVRYGLSLEFFPPEEVTNDYRYFRARTFQVHDIEHAVVGFGSDIVGELGMIGFMIGQAQAHIPGRVAYSLVATYGGLMGSLYGIAALHRSPAAIPSYVKNLRKGIAIGRRARPLFGVRWEESFDEPIARVRERFGLPQVIAQGVA